MRRNVPSTPSHSATPGGPSSCDGAIGHKEISMALRLGRCVPGSFSQWLAIDWSRSG